MPQRTVIPVIILVFLAALPLTSAAQDNTSPDASLLPAALERAPTAAEVMRERISKAKAMLAVRNFGAALYELQNIKRENSEPAVNRVVDVLLMHAYLELSDYPRAKKLLKELESSKSADSSFDYLAVAGQVVSGAREQTERYRSLGLSINDRNLPTVAAADIQGMRDTLEMVIQRSKDMMADREVQGEAAALLEESSVARGALARDAYDAKLWKDQLADAREQMISSRSVVLSSTKPLEGAEKEAAVGASKIENNDLAVIDRDESYVPDVSNPKPKEDSVAERRPERKTIPINPPPRKNSEPGPSADFKKPAKAIDDPAVENKPVPEPVKEKAAVGPTDRPVRIIGSAKKKKRESKAGEDQPNVRSSLGNEKPSQPDKKKTSKPESLTLGSLIGYATRKVNPIYPRQAKSMRLTGVVTIKIMVDEDGSVADIVDMEGPSMLTRAAEDAIRKWKFRPFKRDGQPVKASGFVSFNFSL